MKLGVKTCGAMSELDIQKATLGGAKAIGVVCRSDRAAPYTPSPNSHTVSVERATQLIKAIPDELDAVLLPRRTSDFNEILYMAEVTRPDRIQIGETESLGLAKELHTFYRGRPGPEIAQVLHVDADTNPREVDAFLGKVGFIHLDSAGARYGGNGVTHDWEISRKIAERAHEAGTPVILAGGLTVGNVAEAIDVVQADGVDVETGIRPFGVYNQKTIIDFVQAAHAVRPGEEW